MKFIVLGRNGVGPHNGPTTRCAQCSENPIFCF